MVLAGGHAVGSRILCHGISLATICIQPLYTAQYVHSLKWQLMQATIYTISYTIFLYITVRYLYNIIPIQDATWYTLVLRIWAQLNPSMSLHIARIAAAVNRENSIYNVFVYSVAWAKVAETVSLVITLRFISTGFCSWCSGTCWVFLHFLPHRHHFANAVR